MPVNFLVKKQNNVFLYKCLNRFNKYMYSIKLIPKNELDTILPFLKMLDNNIPEDVLISRLEAMKQNNYECVGIYDNDKLIGLSGLWTLVKYYVGKHIEPDNVIIHPDHRLKGAGEQLMQWIFEYARSKGCVATELNCYVNNQKGVAFWERLGYRTIGYHMQKKL